MNLPLQITFRNVRRSSIVEGWIQAEAAKLDTFYDRIMSCRVAVEIPHRHHKKGDQYHIRIDLTLPGKEIVIKRKPSLRSRAHAAGKTEVPKQLELETPHKNLRSAINDAFRSAGRRLQDYGRRQRGDVKTHEPLPIGRVSKLLPEEGYGFLSAADGREVYFHKDSVLNRGFRRLEVGSPVTYVEEQGEKGPQASTVRLLRAREIHRAA
jgi:cold shock CspA family protein